jgi:hypothetical protein
MLDLSFEMSGTAHPTTRRRLPQEPNTNQSQFTLTAPTVNTEVGKHRRPKWTKLGTNMMTFWSGNYQLLLSEI